MEENHCRRCGQIFTVENANPVGSKYEGLCQFCTKEKKQRELKPPLPRRGDAPILCPAKFPWKSLNAFGKPDADFPAKRPDEIEEGSDDGVPPILRPPSGKLFGLQQDGVRRRVKQPPATEPDKAD